MSGHFLGIGIIFTSIVLSGCGIASPTYGTSKTAGAQLLSDVSTLAAFTSKNGDKIEYTPRPELVKPAKGQPIQLPALYEHIAQTDGPGNPLGSQKSLRKGFQDEVIPNQSNSPLISHAPAATNEASPLPVANSRSAERMAREHPITKEQVEDFHRRKELANVNSQTTRRYLSEPPGEYRQTSPSAPTGDLGQNEEHKQRQHKATAVGQGKKS